MDPIQIILIAVIVFVVAAIGLFMMTGGGQTEQQKKTLDTIKGKTAAYDDPMMDQNKRREELAKKLKESKESDAKKVTLPILIGQAGLTMSVRSYWMFSVLAMVGLAFAAKFFGQPPFVIGAAAVIGFFGLPRFVLKKLAATRQKQFLEEFPDALEAMVRLLKAGMPVSEAISMISREFDGPVGEEMTKIYDKQKIGVPLYEAAYEAARTMPITEMQMFATGLAIQAQTGSSLSEVLMNLSNVIRARFRLKRKIKALSSEAIASASIIGALPILVATGMYFANYEYIAVLLNDPFGNVLLAGATIWMMVGIFVMKAMINFKV